MEVGKLKNIKMSLMQSKGEINEKTKKAEYEVKGSASFEIKPEFYKDLGDDDRNDLTEGLLGAMYDELLDKIKGVDTVGIWIDYDGKQLENSIKIETLEDIEKYSVEKITPVYELFKMTIEEN